MCSLIWLSVKKMEHSFQGNNEQTALIWSKKPPKGNLYLIEETSKLSFDNCSIQTDIIQNIVVYRSQYFFYISLLAYEQKNYR